MLFCPGQRWISDGESDQGLGTVITVETRFVTILYTATGDSRKYAIKEAPLTRIKFKCGDIVPSHEGWQIKVGSVEEQQGLLTYGGTRQDTGKNVFLKEVMIDHFIKFNNPHDRLINGQVDRLDWFRLRRDCLQHQFVQQQSPLMGLLGGRVSLIPHQLYIAEEVGKRFAPRVLLADEVGLGKTIEAGLIIHQQLVSGRAQRVLIIVPEPLMHQWLVEMLRRFNLHFSIFDNDRCIESAHESEQNNPFSSEQLVLVNLDFISKNKQWHDELLAEKWDLMVVDEAHHLVWTPAQPSVEYRCIEQLAQKISGVLLLTATPDQLGHQGHFARLKLLDADRFFDYQKFIEEESKYNEVAAIANAIIENQNLTIEQQDKLTLLLKETDITPYIDQFNDSNEEIKQQAGQQLLKQLLDRHGTGRILFRNSRNTIKGFPKRELHATALSLPELYQVQINDFINSDSWDILAQSKRAKYLFTPEILYSLANNSSQWFDIDPRVDFLIELLQLLSRKAVGSGSPKEKILVICAHAQTAIDLEQALRVKAGIRAAIFHEGLSIFERDKAAAYFAQAEDSAQVLLCSEIGSEGRNFQFSHHLVLFDLPVNPDLLEQRIGRLDRIGQNQIIKIHVPYFENSAQALLFNWYHQSLNAFEQTCITGRAVFEYYGEMLMSLALQGQEQTELGQQLIDDSHAKHLNIKAVLESGRDKLLEMHSSGQGQAQILVKQIEQQDQQIHLPQFMFQVFDVFGIDQDDKADFSIALNTSEHMLTPNFPCLPEDGTTITFSRDVALNSENYQLLTWDHPMVSESMELILSQDIGNASIGLLKNPALPVGTFFLECYYTLEAMAPNKLQIGRYLPTTPVRVLVDAKGMDLSDKIGEKILDDQIVPVKKQIALQLTKALNLQISPLVVKAEDYAYKNSTSIKAQALATMKDNLNEEQQRLIALAAINPNVRQEEIDFIQSQREKLCHYIDNAQLKFEAIRLIVVSH